MRWVVITGAAWFTAAAMITGMVFLGAPPVWQAGLWVTLWVVTLSLFVWAARRAEDLDSRCRVQQATIRQLVEMVAEYPERLGR